MKIKDFVKLVEKLSNKYYGSVEEDVIFKRKHYVGYMFGNDECFDCDDFYQFFLTPEGLYKFYYDIPKNGIEMINYKKPCAVTKINYDWLLD